MNSIMVNTIMVSGQDKKPENYAPQNTMNNVFGNIAIAHYITNRSVLLWTLLTPVYYCGHC